MNEINPELKKGIVVAESVPAKPTIQTPVLKIKSIQPKFGVLRSSMLFLAGVGLAGIMSYSSIFAYIKRSDESLKKEVNNLRVSIEKNQSQNIENGKI